jgi:hypothetical protein
MTEPRRHADVEIPILLMWPGSGRNPEFGAACPRIVTKAVILDAAAIGFV